MDITLRQGETLQIPIEADDTSAVSVQFQVAKDGTVYIDETVDFTDGKATVSTNDTMLALGEYEYMLTVTYSDGVIDILPDPEDCDTGDCELPKLIVCQGTFSGAN